MQSFTKYILESIKIDKDTLKFDYIQNDKISQTTKMGKNNFIPFVKHTKFLHNVPVYSVYPFSGDDYNEIYKSIKRKTTIKMSDDDYKLFLSRTAQFISSRILDKAKIDYILTPQSSSFLVRDITDEIIKRNPHINVFHSVFIKNKINDITIDYKDVEVQDKTKQNITNTFEKLKSKSNYLEAKLIPKQFLQFFTNLYKLSPNVAKKIEEKNIAIVDDSISSATSMRAFIEAANAYNPKSIIGITIFKSK